MKIIGLDVSLRSSGLTFFDTDTNQFEYKLIQPSPKVYNDEDLLIYITDEILSFITIYKPSHIGLEGLSYNSLSSNKDLIDGLHWMLRCEIIKQFPYIKLDVVPVLTWRSKIFNKEERKLIKEISDKVKLLKIELKSLSKEDKKILALENENLIRSNDIKFQTWLKLPEPYKSMFEDIGFKKGCFDLSDSFFINQYVSNLYK